MIGFGSFPFLQPKLLGICRGLTVTAPSLDPDADDTSKGILALALLRNTDYEMIPLDRVIAMFETDTHFRTYPGERDPSYSANCHVLLAILHHPYKGFYAKQIRKVAQFLCDRWWTADGAIRDKWVGI